MFGNDSVLACMSVFLDTAIDAAQQAGDLLRSNFEQDLKVDAQFQHDIKLELDVRSQELITGILLKAFPDHALYGEEGISGNADSAYEWVVDPIDGTVNYFYGIPHFCISIALRENKQTIVGVILDPMRNELWTAERGSLPTLNGKQIRVSTRTKIADAALSVGVSKTESSINRGYPLLGKMIHRARKCRMMGSAALDLAYIACGRLDAYIEQGVSLWDIAAGIFLIESAGGKVDYPGLKDHADKFAVVASNGKIDLQLED